MEQQHWKLTTHEDFDFASFMRSLTDSQKLVLSIFLTKVAEFEFLVHAPRSWIKPLGDGLFEFRISETGILLRLFFTYRKGRIIILLAGYDKGKEPSSRRQQREITLARKRLKDG